MSAPPCRRLALAALVVVAACAKKDETPAPVATPTAAAPASAPNVVTVVAGDYSFRLPDSVPAGATTFRLVNEGKELHHIVVVKASPEMLQKMDPHAAPPPDVAFLGGPNAAVPGMAVEATLELEPGEYSLICMIPTAENIPHVVKGMVRRLIVTGPAPAPAALPAADIVLTLTDYAFAFSTPLTPGRHVIRVENNAAQPHEIVIVRMAPGKTARDMDAWAHNPKGPPPGMPVASASPISRGRSMVFPVTLEAGDYALLCFFPDAKDGKFHTGHGMIQDIKI